MRCWEGLCHRDTETGPLPQQWHIPIQLITMGVRTPGFEVFCICECGSTSNACSVYVRSGRILFALLSCVYLAEVQTSTIANIRRTCQFEMLYEQNVELTLLRTLINSERNNI